MAKVDDRIRRLNDFYPFQKPVTRVIYDKTRERILAGGMDGQVKFFEIKGEDKDQLSVCHKIKLPCEVENLAIS